MHHPDEVASPYVTKLHTGWFNFVSSHFLISTFNKLYNFQFKVYFCSTNQRRRLIPRMIPGHANITYLLIFLFREIPPRLRFGCIPILGTSLSNAKACFPVFRSGPKVKVWVTSWKLCHQKYCSVPRKEWCDFRYQNKLIKCLRVLTRLTCWWHGQPNIDQPVMQRGRCE